MPRPAQDPLSILGRIPELEGLAERDKGVRRAIERGRAHALYRRLFWMKTLRRAGDDAELVKALLERRRLFFEPLKGAPIMFTYNGCGSTIYGSDDRDPNDGTYVKTLFLVLVFVPLFPFGSYLVRDGESSNSWFFIGRLPLGAFTYLWQRLVALGIVAGVASGIVASVDDVQNNTVHVVNSLAAVVRVRVGGQQEVDVLPQSVAEIRSAVGEQRIEVFSGGQQIESGTIDVRRGYDAVTWNVLGLGAVYRVPVRYVPAGLTPEDSVPTIHCGEQAILEDDVDYVFTDPPQEIQMPKGASETTKMHVGFERGSPQLCINHLSNGTPEQRIQGARLAARYAEALRYDAEAVSIAVARLIATDQTDAALTLAESAKRANDGVIDYHRYYQDGLERTGQLERALREYRERFEKDPSADNAYLVARLNKGSEGRAFVEEALKKSPRHPYLLRMAGYCARLDGDFTRTAEVAVALRDASGELYGEFLELHIDALAGLGRIEEARTLVAEGLATPDLDVAERIALVRAGLLLNRFEPAAEDGSLLSSLEKLDKNVAQVVSVRARVDSAIRVSPDEIEALKSEEMKEIVAVAESLLEGPGACFPQVTVASPDAIGLLPLDMWALLTAEAARTSDPQLEKLKRASPLGQQTAEALVHYVKDGTQSELFDGFPMPYLAAAHFVRSRQGDLPEAERLALVERAKHEDVLHGVVTKAMASWPK